MDAVENYALLRVLLGSEVPAWPIIATWCASLKFLLILAGLACAFAGLCYAEFSAMIPISGSAYTYCYATLGEFIAWIIGWDLILEYAVGASTVLHSVSPSISGTRLVPG